MRGEAYAEGGSFAALGPTIRVTSLTVDGVKGVRAWTIAVVAVCGAVLMIAEFAGARMLEIRWGSSLIVWGSTIAVVLGGMAVGYTAGGRLADRRPGPRTLVGVLLAAAGTLLAVAFAGPSVLDWIADLLPGPRAGSLTGALMTLAASAGVLAAASPVALTAVLTAKAAGRDAGRVYAAGAVGSVVGSLGAAFWLVELAGLRALLAGCAAVLVVCAAVGMLLLSSHRRGWMMLAAGVPALALASAALYAASGSYGGGVRAHVETGELSVSVVDEGPIRRLVFPGRLVQSEQDVRVPGRLRLGYTHAIHGATCHARELGRVLMIGVGGGSLVRSIHRVAPEARIDAVELHRPVLELARRWFGLPAGPWVAYHVDDGRRFLTRSNDRYDLIILDAFGTERVPPHLLSREFMTLARDRLNPGGVFAANVIADTDSDLAEAVHATATDAFGSAEVREPVPETGNLIWTVPAGDPRPGCEASQASRLDLPPEAVGGARVEVAVGRVLTDDHNPAGSLSRD
jgi:predicted membrane-bound spermidine synthase